MFDQEVSILTAVPTATRARPDRSSTVKATAPEPSFAGARLPHPDHPGRRPRLGARHDAGARRRARPDLDAQPPAHLPRHRRPGRQGPGHPPRAEQRPRPRARGARRHRGRPPHGEALAGHAGAAPPGRPHRAAGQADAARARRPRQRGAPRRPAGGLRAGDRRADLGRPPTTTSSTSGAGRAHGRSGGSSTRPSTRPIRRRRGGRSCASAPATSSGAPSRPSGTARSCPRSRPCSATVSP